MLLLPLPELARCQGPAICPPYWPPHEPFYKFRVQWSTNHRIEWRGLAVLLTLAAVVFGVLASRRWVHDQCRQAPPALPGCQIAFVGFVRIVRSGRGQQVARNVF